MSPWLVLLWLPLAADPSPAGAVPPVAVEAPVADDEAVLVLPTQAHPELAPLVEVASAYLPGRLRDATRAKILGMSELDAILAAEKVKDLVGCTDVQCFTELAGPLGARWLVRSELLSAGDDVLLRLSLIDTRDMSLSRDAEARVLKDGAVLKFAIAELVGRLFGTGPLTGEAPPLRLPAELAAERSRANNASSADSQGLDRWAQSERVAQELSGMPLTLWIGEGWTAYEWQKFKASGLTRRDFIARETEEDVLPFVLELFCGGLTVVGIPTGMALLTHNKAGSDAARAGDAAYLAGGLSLMAFVVVGTIDLLANSGLEYLGDEP